MCVQESVPTHAVSLYNTCVGLYTCDMHILVGPYIVTHIPHGSIHVTHIHMGLYMYETLMSHKCVVHIHVGLCMCDTYACVHLMHTSSRYVMHMYMVL